MSNDSYREIPQTEVTLDPAKYYRLKQQAIKHCRGNEWQHCLSASQELTKKYKNDGVTWYLMGLGYFNTQQYKKSITPLKKALSLGSNIKKIPTGASNPNDLMVKIAEAYSLSNDKQSALYWLKKALETRWDDRPKLAGRSLFQQGKNKHFATIENSDEFKRLAGNFIPPNLTRKQSWLFDLHYLVSEVKRLHVDPYHKVSQIDFKKQVEKIELKIDSLNDQQIIFEFMKLIGSLGNGHNFIIPAWGKHGNFTQLPFQFYQFTDGLFIVDAHEGYKNYIGYEVTKFGDTPSDEALKKISEVNARDNNMQQLWLGPYYLSLLPVLQGLEIIDKGKSAELTLVNRANEKVLISPTATDMTFSGFPKLHPNTSTDVPLYLQQNNNSYWSTLLSNDKIIYVQFNDVRDKSCLSLKDFNAELVSQIQRDGIEHFILDLRHNSGGDGSITPPMVATAIFFKTYKPEGKLFVFVGRNTFSAGHDLLMKISRLTAAVIVGEPSGTRPNALGEAGWFNLPYSNQTGILSSQFHQEGGAEDHRIWVAPDVPVTLSSEQYLKGEDPSLKAAYSILGFELP